MKMTKTIAKIALLILFSAAAFAQVDLKSLDEKQLHTLQQQIQKELDLREAQKQAALPDSPEMQEFMAYEAAVAAVESAVQKKDRAAFDTAYKTAMSVKKSEIPEAKAAEFDALTARLNAALPNTPANSEKDFKVELTKDENGVVITGIKEEAVAGVWIGGHPIGKPVVIPSEIQGMPVRSINLSHHTERFDGRASIFIVPEGVKNVYIETTIASEIKELRLSEGVEFLTIRASESKLGKINFPSTLKIVHGFLSCEYLETSEFVIPEGVLIWACNLVHSGRRDYAEEYVPNIKKLVLPKSVYFEGGSSGIFPDLRCGGTLEDVVVPNGAEYSCNTSSDARTLENLCGKFDSLAVQKKLRNTVFKRRDMNAAEKAAVSEYANWLGKRYIIWYRL